MYFILFIVSYILVFIIYQFFLIIPAKKRFMSGDSKKELVEIKYLRYKYNLDFNKISYVQLLQICGIVSSFDIVCVVTVISLFSLSFFQVLFCFIFTLFVIFISYHFVYFFYKSKGYINK